MSRRLVIGANSAGAIGIFASDPGWDAWSAPESHLRFSSLRRHFMLVQSGTVTLGAANVDVRVNFTRTLNSVPFVLCGVFNPKVTASPVGALPDTTGFYARALVNGSGAAPAAGQNVPYYAYLKGLS